MKATTLNTRIDKNLRTKSGSIQKKFEDVITLISNPSIRIHPLYYRGWSKGYTLLGNYHIAEGLRLIGIDFTTGNDAPRGGQQGYFIELTQKGRRQVADFCKQKEIERQKAKLELEEAARLIQEAKKARFAELSNLQSNESDESILFNFFQNEVHPCPQIVLAAKIRSGKAWNELRAIFK